MMWIRLPLFAPKIYKIKFDRRYFYSYNIKIGEKIMKEQIIELLHQRKTYNQIVKEVGCAKSTISYHANI